MLSWIRKQAGSPWVKALMIVVAVTFFGGFGLLSSTKVQSCLGIDEEAGKGQVLAKVDGQEIKEREFRLAYNRQYQNLLSSLRSQSPDQSLPEKEIDRDKLRREVMEGLIQEKLVLKEADRLGIDVSDSEVQREIVRIFSAGTRQGFNPKNYRRVLASQGISETYFESKVREDVRYRKLLDAMAGGADLLPEEVKERYAFKHESVKLEYLALDPSVVAKQALPDESEVQEYYEEHKVDFYLGETRRVDYLKWDLSELLPLASASEEEIKEYYQEAKDRYLEAPPQVKVRHIILRVSKEAPEIDVIEAQTKIEEIRREAQKPDADFAELASKYSEGPTRDDGGDLGWFTKKEYASELDMQALLPDLEEAAFAIEEGEVSEPVRTDFGFHLLMVEEKKEAEYSPFEEVEEKVEETILTIKALEAGKEKANQIKSRVEKGDSLTNAAREAGREVKTSEWFQLSDDHIFRMPDSSVIIEKAFELDMNELSEPLLGDEHVYLIKVVEKKPERQGTLEEVKDRIIAKLKPAEEMKSTLDTAQDYLSQLKQDEISTQELADKEGIESGETDYMERAEVLIQGVGYSDTLEKEVDYMNPENTWPQKPVILGEKVVIIHLLDLKPPDMEEFEEEKEEYKTQLLAKKQNEVVQTWLDSLKEGRVEYTERWWEIVPPKQ